MALNLDVSELTQAAAMKATPHDNCIVLDLGTGPFPRDIEVRLPDDDGARQNALWDGSLNLSVNDEVLCFEYSGLSAWRVMGMGGNDGGAGKVRVSEVWESDFGAVALQSDADGKIGIGTAGPDAKLDVLTTAGAQLRLTFENEVKFADFTVNTNHDLLIKTSSTGGFRYQPTVDQTDSFQILDADGGAPVVSVDTINENTGFGGVALTNAKVNIAGNTIGGNAFGMYMGGATITPGDTFSAFWGYFGGGSVQTGAANTIANSYSLFVAPITKGGTGTITNTYGAYIRMTNAGANNYGAYIQGRVGINKIIPVTQLDIEQSSGTAAIAVLSLKQADLSEEFVDFIATIGAGNPIDTAAIGTYYGKFRVAVNGTFKYIPLHNS